MHHVVIEKLCNCALKRELEQLRSFDTYEEAEDHAQEWAQWLNDSLCGTHGFDVISVDRHFIILTADGGYCESCEIE